MRDVWIVGATSHVAKALIAENLNDPRWDLSLVARDLTRVKTFLESIKYPHKVRLYPMEELSCLPKKIESIINCVGFGTPKLQSQAGFDLFRLTEEIDNKILNYLIGNKETKFISFSSGAVYGSSMELPVSPGAVAEFELDPIGQKDWYRISKLHQEAKHQSLPEAIITDIRLFSFFSRFIDTNAGFLMSDVVRALTNGTELVVSMDEIFRDFIAPSDLFGLIDIVLQKADRKLTLDTYSAKPISKSELLGNLTQEFGLTVRYSQYSTVSPTGIKPYYYSATKNADSLGYRPMYSSWEAIVKTLRSMDLGESQGKDY